jgi:putative ABC transport system permease protein
MYLRILKRDLKRKKSMNIILLAFILLATMFVASSVSNIFAITGALDGYFEKAGIPDLIVASIDRNGETSVTKTLDSIDAVGDYQTQPVLFVTKANLTHNGAQLEDMGGTGRVYGFEDVPLTLFDAENAPINQVAPGTILVHAGADKYWGLEVGDAIQIHFGETSRSFTVAGYFKDASLIGSFVIPKADFDYFLRAEEDTGMMRGSLCYIHTADIATVKNELSQDDSINAVMDQSDLRTSYIMDMIIAGILLAVSVCLIVVAFVMLRFTINFTLTEEFRQIGVMKAIGIPNVTIRGLYMVKYAVLALVGAIIGFFASIPFGEMMLRSVSETMVMEAVGGVLVNGLCSVLVVAVTLLFCFSCTGKVKKYTPVDAIRSGTTGERFKKKGILRLSKFPMKPGAFMSFNDVLSSPKRFGIVIVIFALCLSLVLMLVTSVNTLKSEKLITVFGMSPADVYLVNDTDQILTFFGENGRDRAEAAVLEMEQLLEEEGMPGKCAVEVQMTLLLVHGQQEHKSIVNQGIGNSADRYAYYKGTAPQYENEIALTGITAEKLGAEIGDTITIRQLEGDKQYIVTGLFQSMINMGDGVRLHEDAQLSFGQLSGVSTFQIDFEGTPSQDEIRNRIDRLKEIYGTEAVYGAAEYVEEMAGVAETLDSIRKLVLTVVLIIIVLVTVLTEQSFITKERSEIAILKAVGIRNGTILVWHTLRFGIVAIFAAVLSLLTLLPMTKLVIGPIFAMMGADFGVEFVIRPLEVYVIYPALVLSITMVSAFLTALSTRSIHARECSGVD